MRTWLVSDTHFGNQPKERCRPLGTTSAERDAIIARRWADLVAPSDVVWHLGDVGDPKQIAALPGVKHLIFGNYEPSTRQAEIRAQWPFGSFSKRMEIDTEWGAILLTHGHLKISDWGDFRLVIHGHHHGGNALWQNAVNVTVDMCDWGPIELHKAIEWGLNRVSAES